MTLMIGEVKCNVDAMIFRDNIFFLVPMSVRDDKSKEGL